MLKKQLCMFLSGLLVCLLFSGCWDYHGLDELSIVAGIAIDECEDDPDLFAVTFEVIDIHSTGSSDEQRSKIIETRGRTISEAVYNASAKFHEQMYFGNCEVVVVSYQTAARTGLNKIIDPLLRDAQIRDNLSVLISGESTAREIITPTEDSGYIISFDLNFNLESEKHSSNSTRALELYQIYNILALETTSLSLPVIRFSQENDEGEFALDGLALFEQDRMTGYLKKEDMPYFLLAVSRLKGGGYIVYPSGNQHEEIFASLANRKSTPNQRYEFDGTQFKFFTDVKMTAAAIEFSTNWNDLRGPLIRNLEQEANRELSNKMVRVMRETQQEGYDIFGFSDLIRNTDLRLWEEIKEDWPEWFAGAEFSANIDIRIDNTGMIENYQGV